jgi:NADPH:quinone reductase-like Zn-dependent oxidoreductase
VITWGSPHGKTSDGCAEFVRASVRNVSPMPKSLNFAQAAAVPIASLTAFQSLFHAEKGGTISGLARNKLFCFGAWENRRQLL